jgi:hypothetical protein
MRKDLYGHYINENAIFDLRFAGLFIWYTLLEWIK